MKIDIRIMNLAELWKGLLSIIDPRKNSNCKQDMIIDLKIKQNKKKLQIFSVA